MYSVNYLHGIAMYIGVFILRTATYYRVDIPGTDMYPVLDVTIT